MNVRMIDCVGYIVPSSLGYFENEAPRMVKTPWFEGEVPFNMAAEVGTQKVITEHSTIGIVITTDGSIDVYKRQIIGGFFIHLYVFPRTNVFKEAGIPANEAVTIEVQKNGYSDVNSVTDETSKDFILEKLSDLRITKAYRYEHNETDSPPSYIYTFHTKESERFFSVRFYDSGEKIDIIKYNAETKKLIGFEYTVEMCIRDSFHPVVICRRLIQRLITIARNSQSCPPVAIIP